MTTLKSKTARPVNVVAPRTDLDSHRQLLFSHISAMMGHPPDLVKT